MKRLIAEGKWNQFTGWIKQQYGNLTDDDLAYVEGKEEEVKGKIKEKIGASEEELQKLVDKFNSKYDEIKKEQ